MQPKAAVPRGALLQELPLPPEKQVILSKEESDTLDKKIDYWKRKLLDLSRRNNLVNYRPTKARSIGITFPSPKELLSDLDLEVPVRFLKQECEEPLDGMWKASEDDSIIEKKLYTIYLRSRENFRELGINTSFVSFGLLKYRDKDAPGGFSNAPLLLYPVQLERIPTISLKTQRIEILSGSDDLRLNPAIREKLSQEFNLDLADYGGEQDPFEYLEYVKKAIAELPTWSVTDECYLDIFSYQKYVMYEDLEKTKAVIKMSPLVRAYAGNPDALEVKLSQEELNSLDDSSSVDALPCDSSQKHAIELAKRGASFVLEGPPGTGKSQCVANIIAALIAQNKKVLFVSQKMAALDVVQHRLDRIGLGRYCLNLHSYQGNKREVVDQLMQELETSPQLPPETENFSFSAYLSDQKEINDYYRFLCEKRGPWNLSPYQMRGEVAIRQGVAILDTHLGDLLNLEPGKLSEIISKIRKLDALFEKLGDPEGSILFDYKPQENTSLSREKLSRSLDLVILAYAALNGLLSAMKKDMGADAPLDGKLGTLISMLEYCPADEPKIGIFFKNDFEARKQAIKAMSKSLSLLESSKKFVLERMSEAFLQSDSSSAYEKFCSSSALSRLFDGAYKEQKRIFDTASKKKMGHGEALQVLEAKEAIKRAQASFDSDCKANAALCVEIGDYRNTILLSKLAEAADRLSPSFDLAARLGTKKPEAAVKFVCANLQAFSGAAEQAKSQIDIINAFFDVPSLSFSDDPAAMAKKAAGMKRSMTSLDDLMLFKDTYSSLPEEVRFFAGRFPSASRGQKFSEVFLKSYYLQVLDGITRSEGKRAPKMAVENFLRDDFIARDMYRYKIMESVEKRQPQQNYVSTGSNELYLLKREHEKKSKLKPIRELLESMPNLVFALKPCFMMSPLTVSQYISPQSIIFDAVIFDEASQIMPEDAVSSLARAKQVIVMGDTKQLPPTTFFLSQDETDVEEGLEDLDSFLSEASTRFMSDYLLWHYRSRNENLIAFSNNYFYDGRLITFPNRIIGDDSGLDFVYVKNGVYARSDARDNPNEAKEVVKLYKKLMVDYPDKSIGIIAFSISQEDAIRKAFNEAGILIEESMDTVAERPFLKNLETVQGDERDIIILSVGYGKDAKGKFIYNFGPLNKEGGYKRLNVSITRSRFKTVVVSSLQPEELVDVKIGSEGLRYLKKYIHYAKYKDFSAISKSSADSSFSSMFEKAVSESLDKAGLFFTPRLGTSGYRVDFAIKSPKNKNEYLLAVDCDGSQYEASRYARDRDKNRKGILEEFGWGTHRIWSEDWLNDRQQEINIIKSKVSLLAKGAVKPEKKKEEFLKPANLESFKETKLEANYQPYKVTDFSAGKAPYLARNDWSGGKSFWGLPKRGLKVHKSAIEALQKTLETESPIEKSLLYKRIVTSVGRQQVSRNLAKQMGQLLAQMANEKKLYLYGETVSLKPIDFFTPVRVSTEEQRPFEYIPKEELASAAMDILRNTFSISREALASDVARRVYLRSFAGAKTKSKIDAAVDYLYQGGHIEIVGQRIVLKGKAGPA